MIRVKTLINNSFPLENFAWASFGIGGGALLTGLSNLATVEFSKVIDGNEIVNWRAWTLTTVILCVGLMGIIIGVISLFHARDKKRLQATLAEQLFDDMKEISARPQQQSATQS